MTSQNGVKCYWLIVKSFTTRGRAACRLYIQSQVVQYQIGSVTLWFRSCHWQRVALTFQTLWSGLQTPDDSLCEAIYILLYLHVLLIFFQYRFCNNVLQTHSGITVSKVLAKISFLYEHIFLQALMILRCTLPNYELALYPIACTTKNMFWPFFVQDNIQEYKLVNTKCYLQLMWNQHWRPGLPLQIVFFRKPGSHRTIGWTTGWALYQEMQSGFDVNAGEKHRPIEQYQ